MKPVLRYLPALFLPSKSLNRVHEIPFQPVGLRLPPSNGICTALTNQSSFILPLRAVPFGPIKPWGFGSAHLHEDRPIRQWVGGTSVYISQLPPGWDYTLPFHPRLHFPGCAATRKMSPWNTAGWSRLAQIRADQSTAEWTNTVQSPPARSRAGLSSQKEAWPHYCLTAVLFSQLCCTTVEPFCTD